MTKPMVNMNCRADEAPEIGGDLMKERTNTPLVVIGTVIVVLLLLLVFGGGRMMSGGMMNWWR